jgi:hypothetical protein
LRVTSSTFTGLGDGHGHIQSWSATVEAIGRGAAARRRQASVVLYAKPLLADLVDADLVESGVNTLLTDNQCADDLLDIENVPEFRILQVAKAG